MRFHAKYVQLDRPLFSIVCSSSVDLLSTLRPEAAISPARTRHLLKSIKIEEKQKPTQNCGRQAEVELKLRTCREAEKLLNQYFVFVGKHSTRHVASSLLLAYVFSREPSSKKSGEAGEEADRTGAATLVAMLHSLSTRFVPDVETLRQTCRDHAYEEIRRRDAPLFEHLSTLFPGESGVVGSFRCAPPGTKSVPSARPE